MAEDVTKGEAMEEEEVEIKYESNSDHMHVD
jgi:hypothetical protein